MPGRCLTEWHTNLCLSNTKGGGGGAEHNGACPVGSSNRMTQPMLHVVGPGPRWPADNGCIERTDHGWRSPAPGTKPSQSDRLIEMAAGPTVPPESPRQL
jgi:hypothetical protein